MALQIKAPETIRVIQELARRTGQSEERVVDVAVRERLAQLRTPEEEEERRARVYAIVQDLQARFKASGQPIVDPDELFTTRTACLSDRRFVGDARDHPR